MKICIFDNDTLAPEIQPQYGSYGAMFVKLFHDIGASDWTFDIFHTPSGHYPASFDAYGAFLLTGSQADAFSTEPWIVQLRSRVSDLLRQQKKLLGVCFGHQLIAVCLGARVARASQGWGVGCMSYDWSHAELPLPPCRAQMKLLASHQDQVLELPPGARLLASNAHCPIAAYAIENQVFCVQGHPEFIPEYSAFLLGKRRMVLGEDRYIRAIQSLTDAHDGAHDGAHVARMMHAFVHAH